MNPHHDIEGKNLSKQDLSNQSEELQKLSPDDDNVGSDDDEKLEPKKKEKKGRRKIKIEFIADKSRRHITFSKRKSGIMKKAYELATLTGTQVLLLVASETGHVYTFATPKLQPIITKPEGKNLIQTCLNSPDVNPSSPQTPQTMQRVPYGDTSGMYGGGDNIPSYDENDKKMVQGRMKEGGGIPTPMNYHGINRGGANVLTVPHNIPYLYQQSPQFSQQFGSPYPTMKGPYPNVQSLQMHSQHHGEEQEN